MPNLTFVTVDPAHFHAALVQKEMYPQVDKRTHVYAPLGGDVLAHLQRIVGFNGRADKPTQWEVEVHGGPDFLERFAREKPGNVVVLAGRNRRKIDYLEKAVAAGLNVLADKPWILVPEDLPRLQKVLDSADQKGLVAFDIMTERFEITSILQRELVQDSNVFGNIESGTKDKPGVYMESVHYLKKLVAGVPLRRPAQYFDIHQQGEGLSDVGTHLVDLVAWMLFPGQPLAADKDVKIKEATRRPTKVSLADFQQITGETAFPSYLAADVQGGQLAYYCNNLIRYVLRNVHVCLDVLWDLEAAAGSGDRHIALFRGSKSQVEVRQGPEENFRPELYVVPAGDKASLQVALEKKIAALQTKFPGVGLKDMAAKFQVTIPNSFRVGHEAHFGQVTGQFLRYLLKEESLPAWEKPNMLAKYFVTTQGVKMSRP